MSRNRLITLILVPVIILIGLLIYSKRADFEKNRLSREYDEKANEAGKKGENFNSHPPTPAPETVAAAAISRTHTIDEKNRELIRSCTKNSLLQNLNLDTANTLDELSARLNAKPQTTAMNIAVKRANGSEERLRIQPHDPSTSKTYTLQNEDVRVFDVNKEGLPITKPFPDYLKSDNLGKVMNTFIAGDRVIFRERKTNSVFANGQSIITETNGKITDAQIIFGKKTLGCAWQNEKLNCACL